MLLVDVLNILREREITATVVIVGREADTAYCAEIRAYATSKGLADRVRFVGPRDDIPVVMSAIDVFASPALCEGFGMVGLEAQAAGTPAVLSNGFPPIIDMGLGTIRWPKSFAPEAWADAVITASQMQRLRPSDVAYRIAECGFSAAENTERIERAWRDPSYLPGESR